MAFNGKFKIDTNLHDEKRWWVDFSVQHVGQQCKLLIHNHVKNCNEIAETLPKTWKNSTQKRPKTAKPRIYQNITGKTNCANPLLRMISVAGDQPKKNSRLLSGKTGCRKDIKIRFYKIIPPPHMLKATKFRLDSYLPEVVCVIIQSYMGRAPPKPRRWEKVPFCI